MLQEGDIDILCICETWLDSSIDDKYISVPRYKILRYDTGRGGGSCLFVREHLKVSIITPDIDREEGVDDILVQIQHRTFASFIVGCVYRHPKAKVSSFTYLSEVFKLMCLKNKPIFIVGDFNDDLFMRGNNVTKIISNLNLKQVIDKPTRITPFSSTLLDLLITNKKDMIVSSIADHEMLLIVLDIVKPRPKLPTITYRSRKNYSQDIFCNLLLNESSTLNNVWNTDNVNTQVEIFTETFIKCLDVCAPVVTIELTRPAAPWIDDNLKTLNTEKNHLQSELKNNRSDFALSDQFKQAKGGYTRSILLSVKILSLFSTIFYCQYRGHTFTTKY